MLQSKHSCLVLTLSFLLVIVSCGSFECPNSEGSICTLMPIKYICKNQNYTSIPLGIDTTVVCVDLSGNMLTAILDDSLASFVDLEKIDFSYNQISFVSHIAFSNISKLNTLSLKDNSIETLAFDTFSSNSLLSNLNLAQNKLKILPHNLFQTNLELANVDISYNDLRELPSDMFELNTEMETLNMSENRINKLPSDMFGSNGASVVFHCEKCFDCDCLHVDAFQWISLYLLNENEMIALFHISSCSDGTYLAKPIDFMNCSVQNYLSTLPNTSLSCVCPETDLTVTVEATDIFSTIPDGFYDKPNVPTGEKATITGIATFSFMFVLAVIVGSLTILTIVKKTVDINTIFNNPKELVKENRIDTLIEDEINIFLDFENNDDKTMNVPPVNHMMKAIPGQKNGISDYIFVIDFD